MPNARVTNEQILAWMCQGRTNNDIHVGEGVGLARLRRVRTAGLPTHGSIDLPTHRPTYPPAGAVVVPVTNEPNDARRDDEPDGAPAPAYLPTSLPTYQPTYLPAYPSPGDRSPSEILIEIQHVADAWFTRLANQHVAIGNWMTRPTRRGTRRSVDRATVSRLIEFFNELQSRRLI